jgi:hypothetical protein
MRLNDVLNTDTHLEALRLECDQFVTASGGYPTRKALPTSYQNIQRVKVRQQKRADAVTFVFNEAFSDVRNLRQRAVITHETPTITPNLEPFYVFPINGYKFLYSKEVRDSSAEYKEVIDTVFERFANTEQAAEIITDIVKYTYTNDNIIEGVRHGAEIIFYNIPYYYAVRQSAFPDYKTILNHIIP